MTPYLIYLLIGFIGHWCATEILRIKTNNSWRWELAATVLWPIAIVCGVVMTARGRSQQQNTTQEKT